MFGTFGSKNKLARYKRFQYSTRFYDVEKETFNTRKTIIKDQIQNNTTVQSLEKEVFELNHNRKNYLPFVSITIFIIGVFFFYGFYNALKNSIGSEVKILNGTWDSNELGQFSSLFAICLSGYLFIKTSKKL